ncbi:uncharacterized protein isoform X2 [Choristoneura fumiferana]|uniref:uncharacterized protein isoform X2 n=1 Tax=Choristoneura fumiferana TaxID=7141 RepID=UPI003D15C7D1
MERWETIVSQRIEPGYRAFEKLLQTASAVLKSDLAPFETEWVIDTLLYKPVDLLRTVSERRGEEVWLKALGDAVKLLAEIVAEWSYAEKYYEDITNLCLLSYDAELRKHALNCLICVTKRSEIGAKNYSRHITSLEQATQCKTPLALLVGAICEHHPSVMCNDINKIWRTYLNMLENNKNTDTLTKAILEGICGLFKHFGEDLPTAELNNFYDSLSCVYMKKNGCRSACFKILEPYAGLFRERVSMDKSIRDQLWECIGEESDRAILNIYRVVSKHVDKRALEKIISIEVLPHTQATHTKAKLTALRILAFVKTSCSGDLSQYVDVQTLENEFRRDKVTHGNADMIQWCIESNLPNSERLLQAAILLYDKLPPTKRKAIVVNGILDSTRDVRQAAVHYLINQSCSSDASLQIWRDLYDVTSDDAIVKSQAVTREFAGYLATAVALFLEERREYEDLPPKLSSLLRLTSKVAPLTSPLPSCAALLCELAESYSTAELTAALRAVLNKAPVEESANFYKSLRIESCRDEAMLHESCLTLIQAPDSVDIEPSNMLFALQIIFSSVTEPTILCDGIKKLHNLLANNKISHQDAFSVICLVQKLRSIGDKTDKHIRILHREVLMFIGKHGNTDVNNNSSDASLDLKSLTLSLPHQGATFRVNLHRVLVLALHHEDPKVLQVFMTMLCANLSSNKEEASQIALTRVIQSVAKIHASGAAPLAAAVQRAATMLDAQCVAHVLQYISTTKSCGVRKLLATALAPLCEDTDILQLIVERGSVMLSSSDSTTKRAGLDVAETIISCLENNNSLCKIILPQILILTAKTYESDAKIVFESASKMFFDKKGLFDDVIVKKTVTDLLKNLIKTKTTDVKMYRTTVKMAVEFVEKIRDVKIDDVLDVVFDMFQLADDVKVVYVLTVLKSVFDFDTNVSRMVLGRDDAVAMNSALNSVFDDTELVLFKLETILMFFEEYCQVMLELKYKETIKLLSDIIAKLTPMVIKHLRRNVVKCFSSLKMHWKETPRLIRNSFQIWTEVLPLQRITEALENQQFLPQHMLCVNALKIMTKIFDTKELILSDVKFDISRWPKLLLKLYSSGNLEDYYFNETPYFNDILTVSLKFLSIADVKKLLLEGRGINLAMKDVGVLFCGFFIQGFSEVLTEEPYFLLDDDMESCSVVLNDLVKYYVKKNYVKEESEKLLHLVDKLWPAYQKHTTFAQKHTLLANLECLKGLGQDSKPLQWVLDSICSQELRIDEKIKLVSFVPEDALRSPLLESVTALFPARLCELRPALLEALAGRPSALYVRTIAALVDNDTSSGWWDEALDSCLSAIGQSNRADICRELYDASRGARVCARVLVPLLRYSSAELCEKFLASILERVLATLKKRPSVVKANHHYQRSIEDYITSLSLLLVAFEKLPTYSLEASSSPLYSGVQSPAPWHVVRETLIRCDALRRCDAVGCPDDASPTLKDTYGQFQCLLYNCYSAAICRRRPSEKVYRQVFGAAWHKIIDEERIYSLPITPSWIKRNRSLPVSVPVESSSLLTSHSHIFLRTLSEHPMLFDLHTQQEDVLEVQDILLPETDLNSHQCAATLTALFRHVAALPFSLWPEVANSLKNGHCNLKWLLAQIICNCKEELKPHAGVLLPGLLAAVATTVADGKCLNGLHLDVLDTVIFWKEDVTSDHLNKIIHHLITTCMEHRRRNTFDGLLKTLYGLLDLYGSSIQIGWESFEPYYTDQTQDTYLKLFQLFRTICKANLYIPQSLEKILSILDTNPSKAAECFGLAMAACQSDSDREELSNFKKMLHKMNVTNFVRVLYYACMGSAVCCGEQEFRKTMNYVSKVASSDRSKCLHIMSVYVANNRPGAYVANMFENVDISEMLVVDPTELFSQPTFQPSAKRIKTETTPILNIHKDDLYGNTVLSCLGVGATDSGGDIASVVREGVGGKLSMELGMRFAECFFITVYLPSLHNKALDLYVCVSAILEMLYSGMRRADNFKHIKLREEPIALSVAPVPTKLLTLSKAFQGTFSSYSTSRARQTNRQEDSSKPSIDVQIPIDDILETLLEFAKTGPEAARSLLTEVLNSVLASSSFDLASRLLPLLGTVLDRPSELTPLCIDVCRILIAHGGSVQGLLAPAEKLRDLTLGTEDAALTTLLYEDVKMRGYGDDMFKLGIRHDTQDVVMDETTTFSLEDLKATFGKLSNWDNLTLQQRRAVRNSSFPPLWTDRKGIVACLDSYEVPADAKSWFDKMAASYRQEMAHNSVGWLRAMDQWPRRHFEISAITEATSWRHDLLELTDIHGSNFTTNECLAEWAARLMVRSSYYNSLQHSQIEEDRINKLSRSHELKWCMRANEMGISRAVLDCVKRNVEDLCVSETLPWLRQKLLAMRSIGLEQNNANVLEGLLEKAKQYNTLKYAENPSVSIELYHLMLLLHKDMESLSYNNLRHILQQVNETSKAVDWNRSPKAAVSSIFEAAMAHYDESWDTGTSSQDSVLLDMTDVFCQAVDLNTSNVDMLLAVILNRLDEFTGKMEAGCCEKLLQKLSPLTPALDQFTLDLIKRNTSKFPNYLLKTCPLAPVDEGTEKYKQCLRIVCDSGHALVSYCEKLVHALKEKDASQWKVILDRIKNKIYENPYTGPSYRLLDKYKDDFYRMYDFDTTDVFLKSSEATLRTIILSLSKEPVLSLRLSDLCPALLQYKEGADRLFGLTGVKIVKFYDKVEVFGDSVRRPVKISMLLSNGKTRRAILKTGESLAGDAAAIRASACAARVCGATERAYSVTLLDEDSALIEFLEGYERLRTLIESAHKINVLNPAMRPDDHDLVESPVAASLQRHNDLCSKVPAYALRSAIEQSSSSVQDFISKKQNFTESLSFMTMIIWILGLGDRHLQNIMLSQDGRLRCVDWGDVWRHGAAELPARLTRNMLAVCDTQVLESRLQTTLTALRGSNLLLEAAIKVSFKWMGDKFQPKFKYIQNILRGTYLSYDVYREVMSEADNLKHKEKHIDLLDYVFRDVERKDVYNVEEQISCLLLHSTSPELLSVTRSGWEPWI